MNEQPSAGLAEFDTAIAIATSGQAGFQALETLARRTVGCKLFTVMTVDMQAGLARRAYTSDPQHYPASGTKPVHHDAWFDIVHKERALFVANTIGDIAKVFPDFELIDSLGCQSVVNLPVVVGDELIATVNLLDRAGFYTEEKVEVVRTMLSLPAKLACLIARNFASDETQG